MNEQILKIGTRGSMLALWQSNMVKDLLSPYWPGTIELQIIKTTGDKILDSPLSAIGSKGLFVKEIEEALLREDVDIAVHSLKDVPTELPGDLTLGAILKREDPRDALVSADGGLTELREGAVIGTSSLRRQSQLKRYRTDFRFSDLRGNLDTRLRKLEEGHYDAIILAGAGIRRLGRESVITELIPTEICLPAVGQGAIAIETRNEQSLLELLAHIEDRETRIATTAERQLLKDLEGGCQIPIGASAILRGDDLFLQGMVADLTGSRLIRDAVTGRSDHAEALGSELAAKLREQGAEAILDEIRQSHADQKTQGSA